jgi:streptogramin lyase
MRVKLSVALSALVAFVCLAPVSWAGAAPTQVSEFTAGLAPESSPEHIVAGPDGNLWFTVRGSYAADSAIGRIAPDGAITRFESGLDPKGNPTSIARGPDGNLWFTDRGSYFASPAIGRVTPQGTITEFAAGLQEGSKPQDIVAGPEGDLWFADRPTAGTASPALGRVTPSGTIGEFLVGGPVRSIAIGADENVWFTFGGAGYTPAIGRVTHGEGTTTITLFHAGLNPGSEPRDVTLGPDGNLWFVDESETTPAVGRVTTSGAITEFSAGLNAASDPIDITTGPDGNLWFADWRHAIGRITPGGAITEFPVDSGSINTPLSIVAGPDGNLWFTDYNEDAVGKATPQGAITEFTTEPVGGGDGSRPDEIVAGPDGNLWFTDARVPAVGRIVPGDDSTPQEQPQPPPPPPGASPWKPTGDVSLASHVATVDRRGVVSARLACSGTALCAGRLTLIASWRQHRHGMRAHRMRRLIGRAHFSIPPEATSTILIHLSYAAWKRLARRRIAAALTVFKTSPFPPRSQRTRIRLVRAGRSAEASGKDHMTKIG